MALSSPSRFIVIAAACLALRPTPLAAQGHYGVPPGQAKKVKPPTSTASTSPGAPSTFPNAGAQPRALGSWLDDASVLAPRTAWMTISGNQWRSPIGRGNDSPIVDLVAGITPSVQATVTLPYSRFTDNSGNVWTGLGDMYVTAKVVLRSTDRGVGVAVAPTLELSNSAVAFDPAADRTHWVLPVSLELKRTGWRTYGSAGYFTRGALFAAGAIERSIGNGLTVTGTLTQSWSTSDAVSAAAYGLSRRRTDAIGGAAWAASPALMLFANVSRTMSTIEFDSSRFAFNAGASVRLTER